MAKKRTKKQKVEAQHQFSLSWSPRPSSFKKQVTGSNVKSQMSVPEVEASGTISNLDSASFSDKSRYSISIKKDIVKSLILAALILASEIVIYLNWTRILSVRFGF